MIASVAGYIGKSGQTFFVLFGDGSPACFWTSQVSDPTIKVNGVPYAALTDRTAFTNAPYVSYPLATRIEPGDVVTFSAAEGWVSFGASSTAPAATDEPVTNWSGQEMFPITEKKTLRLGMNLYGPHPTQTVHILRNLFGHTNGGGGVVAMDDNFRPTEISGTAWFNINNQVTGNGFNDRGTGGVEGIYTVTWRDYSGGRDKRAWLENYDSSVSLVTEIGSKTTLETTASYTRYRRQYQVSIAPAATTDRLSFRAFIDSVDVKDIEVVGPWNDPDSTEYLDGYTRSMLSGISRLRFSQCSECINSNAATYSDCRQPDDISTGLSSNREAQLLKIEPITSCTMTWDGDTFPIADKWTLFGEPNTDPFYFVGIKCTTAAPHGFSTLQGVGLSSIYNLDYANPDDPTDHCGIQIHGASGPVWMRFGRQSQVILFVTGPDTFICYPGYNISTIGIADPIGTQHFDIAGGKSPIGIYIRRIGMIAYEKQIQMASEMEPPVEAHICLSECMTSAGITELATSVLATYQALPVERRPPHIDVEIGDEAWNYGWLMYGRMNALSRVIGHNVVVGATRQCHAYVAGRLTTAFKDVFTAAGLGNVVRRGCWYQRNGDIELAFAYNNGITFEVGGCASYYFAAFPSGAWSPYNTSVDQLHDLWQWMLKYAVVNQITDALSYRDQYMPGMEFVAYEGGEDQYNPFPSNANEMIDWYYSARNYETTQATFLNAQRAGFDQLNLYTFQNGIRTDTGTMWQHAMNNAQKPGLGISPPNLTTATAEPDDNIDLANQNPKLLALRDWTMNLPTPTPTPTPTPHPTPTPTPTPTPHPTPTPTPTPTPISTSTTTIVIDWDKASITIT